MDNRNNTISTSAPDYTHTSTCVGKMEVSTGPNNTYLIEELEYFEEDLPEGSFNGYWTTYYDYGLTSILGTTGLVGLFKYEGEGSFLSTITITFSNNGGLYATTGA